MASILWRRPRWALTPHEARRVFIRSVPLPVIPRGADAAGGGGGEDAARKIERQQVMGFGDFIEARAGQMSGMPLIQSALQHAGFEL